MADLSTEDNALTLAFLHSRAQNLQYTEIRRLPPRAGLCSSTCSSATRRAAGCACRRLSASGWRAAASPASRSTWTRVKEPCSARAQAIVAEGGTARAKLALVVGIRTFVVAQEGAANACPKGFEAVDTLFAERGGAVVVFLAVPVVAGAWARPGRLATAKSAPCSPVTRRLARRSPGWRLDRSPSRDGWWWVGLGLRLSVPAARGDR